MLHLRSSQKLRPLLPTFFRLLLAALAAGDEVGHVVEVRHGGAENRVAEGGPGGNDHGEQLPKVQISDELGRWQVGECGFAG